MCESILRKLLAGLLLLGSLSAYSSDGFWITEDELTELESTLSRQEIELRNSQMQLSLQETALNNLLNIIDVQQNLQATLLTTIDALETSLKEYEREVRINQLQTATISGVAGVVVGLLVAALLF